MIWNDHSRLSGCHAYLGGSKYHWINYDATKLLNSYRNFLAIERGTKLHQFASDCIKLNQKLPDNEKTLNMFVNDAIGYRMESELVLYYSENCFGTADAISFRDNFLRIHDLKTGSTPAHIEQLMIYMALFCLEYRIEPEDIKAELRIYQNNKIEALIPDASDIKSIMGKIKEFDKIIKDVKEREG